MTDALLVLEDGTAFRGRSFGAEGEAFGEAVFNTGHVRLPGGSDRPLVREADRHHDRAHTRQLRREPGGRRVRAGPGGGVRRCVRPAAGRRTGGRKGRFDDYLSDAGVVGIEGIDTRALTLRIRARRAHAGGGRRPMTSTTESLAARVRAKPGMEGADLAAAVSTPEPYAAADVVGPAAPRSRRPFGWPPTTSASSATSCGCWRPAAARQRCSPRRPPPRTSWPAASTASSSPTVRETRRPPLRRSRRPGRLGRRRARVRHLPRAPAARPGAGWSHVQAAVRTSRREPAGEGSGHRRVEITSHNHGFAVDPALGPGRERLGRPEAWCPRCARPSVESH